MRRARSELRGREAEKLVARTLAKEGWDILAQRYAAPGGEIDVIAEKDNLIRFVEVKARHDAVRGAEVLEDLARSGGKRHRAAAEVFLAERPDIADMDCRFDAAIVYPDDTIDWVENIFMG